MQLHTKHCLQIEDIASCIPLTLFIAGEVALILRGNTDVGASHCALFRRARNIFHSRFTVDEAGGSPISAIATPSTNAPNLTCRCFSRRVSTKRLLVHVYRNSTYNIYNIIYIICACVCLWVPCATATSPRADYHACMPQSQPDVFCIFSGKNIAGKLNNAYTNSDSLCFREAFCVFLSSIVFYCLFCFFNFLHFLQAAALQSSSMAAKAEELKAYGKELAKAEQSEEELPDFGDDDAEQGSQESAEGDDEASGEAEPTLASRMAAKQQTISEELEDGEPRYFVWPENCPSQYVHKVKGQSKVHCKRCPSATWSKHALWLYVDTQELSAVDKEDKELLRAALTDHMGRCGSHEDFQRLPEHVQAEAIRRTPLTIEEESADMRAKFRENASGPPRKRRRGGRRGGGGRAHGADYEQQPDPPGVQPKAMSMVRVVPSRSALASVGQTLQTELGSVVSLVNRACAEHGVQPGAPVVTENIEVTVKLDLLVRASEIMQRVSAALSAQNVGLLRLARDIHQENQVLAASYVEMRQVVDEATGSRTAL